MIKYEEVVAFLGPDRCKAIRERIVEDVVSEMGAEEYTTFSEALSTAFIAQSRIEDLLRTAIITEAIKAGYAYHLP